jgi:outer membrane protein assembly factor BamD (BamD/ComL family)
MQQTGTVFHILRGILILLVFLSVFGWLVFRSMKRSEDPVKLLFKWIVTFFVIVAAVWLSRGPVSLVLIPIALIISAVIVVLWGSSIGALCAKPFTSLYDGGDSEIEPRPYYSIAESKRKQGLYTEAVAHIRSQLDRFPTDFQGQMMLAEILAENMNDMQGTDLTIRRICEQPCHAKRNIAYALNSLADWQLKYSKDRESARAALQEVVDRFPESEMAILAAQRIAHLEGVNLLEPHMRERIHVPEGIKNLGLLMGTSHFVPKETDPEKQAEEYVEHLEKFPMDREAREKLAIIYADHFERLDIAEDQLNQLIELPNQPVKDVARWINLLADLQIRHGAGYETACATLERIIEKFPNHPVAELARNRLDIVRLEVKGKVQGTTVKMGEYEQRLGLKHSSGMPQPRPIKW